MMRGRNGNRTARRRRSVILASGERISRRDYRDEDHAGRAREEGDVIPYVGRKMKTAEGRKNGITHSCRELSKTVALPNGASEVEPSV